MLLLSGSFLWNLELCETKKRETGWGHQGKLWWVAGAKRNLEIAVSSGKSRSEAESFW